MFFIKKISQRLGLNKEQNAEQEIEKLGYQQKNQFLKSQGFSYAPSNLKALTKSNGNEQFALQFLQSKTDKSSLKTEHRNEKREMKSHIKEEKQKIKSNNKLLKYEIKLQKMQQVILQYNLQPKLEQLKKMGYDNQVKLIKVLMKTNGDIEATIQFITKKSRWNSNKFKLIGLTNPQECKSKIQKDNNFENNQIDSNLNYPQLSISTSARVSQYPPNQMQFQHSQIYQKQEEETQTMIQSDSQQIKKERRSLIKNSDNFVIPQGVDVDAFNQMMISKQEQMRNEQPPFVQNYPVNPDQAIDFKDEDVEIYIKKNQFLIKQGFKKADSNIQALLKCNGDEQKAIQLLSQKEQAKALKKSGRFQHQKGHNRDNTRGMQSQNNDSSSDSDS